MKYQEVEGDEWFWISGNGDSLACCDCGLVHSVHIRKRKGNLEMKMTRLNRATGQIRRRMRSQDVVHKFYNLGKVPGKNQVKDVVGILKKFIEKL